MNEPSTSESADCSPVEGAPTDPYAIVARLLSRQDHVLDELEALANQIEAAIAAAQDRPDAEDAESEHELGAAEAEEILATESRRAA